MRSYWHNNCCFLKETLTKMDMSSLSTINAIGTGIVGLIVGFLSAILVLIAFFCVIPFIILREIIRFFKSFTSHLYQDNNQYLSSW